MKPPEPSTPSGDFTGLVYNLSVSVVLGLSLLTYIGLAFHIPLLLSVNPAWISMSPITALLMILASLQLTILRMSPAGRKITTLQRMPAFLVVIMSLVSALLYALNIIVRWDPSAGAYPFLSVLWVPGYRMALLTVLLFLLSSCSILLLANGTPRSTGAAHGMMIPVAITSYLVPVSYLLGVQSMHDLLNTPMAFNTGFAFCALSVAVFCTRTDTWLMAVIASRRQGGILVRRLIPVLLFIPILIGRFRLQGERLGYIPGETGVVLVAVAYTVFLLGLLWWSALKIDRSDRELLEAEKNLERSLKEKMDELENTRRLEKQVSLDAESIRKSEERFHRLFNAMQEGFYLAEIIRNEDGVAVDFRFLDVNPAHETLLGMKRSEVVGRTASELFPGLEGRWIETVGRVAATGEPARVEGFVKATGRFYVNFYYSPRPGQFASIFSDITDLKAVEQKLLQTNADLVRREDEVEITNEALRVSRRAALNVMEDALEARREAEQVTNALRSSEQKLKALYASMTEGLANHEILYRDGKAFDYVVTDVNPAFESITGLARQRAVGRRASELYGTGEPPYLGLYAKVASSQIPEYFESFFPPMNKYFAISVVSPERGKFVTIFSDITGRKKREEELYQLNRTLKAIGNSRKAMMRARDENNFLQEICGIILQDCGYKMVWIGFAEEDEGKSVRPAAYAGFDEGYLDTLNLTWADSDRGRGPTGTAIRTGKITLCRNMTTDPAFAPWRENALKRGYASSVAFPLKGRGRAIGAMTIYSREPDPFSEVELGLLGEMADDLFYGITSIRLRAAHAKGEVTLRRSEERLKRAQEIAHMGSWELDPVQNRLVWSDEVFQIFGLNPKEFAVNYEGLLAIVHPDDRAAVDDAYNGSVLEGKESFDIEHRIVRKNDGVIRVVHQKCEHFRDPSGRVIRSVGMVQDITDYRDIEDRLLRTLAELRQSNRELEQFAYSVSHDLRAPVSRIDGFSRALLEDYSDKLDGQGRDFLQRLRKGSHRMSSIIDAILDLSRITRREMKNEEVDLSSLAADITVELLQQEPARKAEFVLQEGLKARGDAALIRTLLENLLGNAWKYTAKRPDARIEFGLSRVDGRDVFFVKDDGAGFDMSHSDKLFTPFQRLHDESDFTGSGIGLATAQRIVHRHGGRISAEGAVGKGASFYFTLWPEQGGRS